MEKRALAAIRISVKKDESTSPERQEQAIRKRVDLMGLTIVGTAADLGVSASKVEPFSRPQLGAWLNHRSDEFDTIVWWRMDRAIRSMTDLHLLIDWAKRNEKQLVFCEGQGSEFDFDFTGGRAHKKNSLIMILATIIAWAAEVESDNISERVMSAHAFLRDRGEWGGGAVPYGFIPARIRGQDRGWKLVHCDETLAVLMEIIDRVIEGESLSPICNDLNNRGVLSPRDWWDAFKDRESKGRSWNTNGMKRILTSRALIGESFYEGRLVVDKSGTPVERTQAVLSGSRWADLQAALAELSMNPKSRYERPNPVLGLAFCARCGAPYYMKQERQKGRTYTSLSCRSRQGTGKSCGQSTISMQYAEAVISELALLVIGREEEMSRRYVPGDDRSEELAMWQGRIAYLKKEWDDLLLQDREEYEDRLRKYQSKIQEIGPSPVRPSGYQLIGSGRTYRESWPTLEPSARRRKLLDLGVRVYLGRGDATAAETAATEPPADRKSHRRQYLANESDVARILAEVTDGSRVKKDFRVWFFQDASTEPHELVHTKE